MTLCLTVADSLSYNPQLFAKLPYDPENSFVPVIRLAWTNNLLVATGNAPFNTYKEMIAYAKANPGKLNWSTWGPATLPDLYLRWISSQAGVTITAIPYGGAAKANFATYCRSSRAAAMLPRKPIVTNASTDGATKLRTTSAASRTGGASPPATINSHEITLPPQPSSGRSIGSSCESRL